MGRVILALGIVGTAVMLGCTIWFVYRALRKKGGE